MASKGMFFILAYILIVSSLLWFSKYIIPLTVFHTYDYIAKILLGCIIMYVAFPSVKTIFCNKRISPEKKAVLITGCDTGFGNLLAKRLDSLGFRVFACCLNPLEKGANDLRECCLDSLHVLELDVRKDESVKAVADYVKKNLNDFDLWAVVNNAGIFNGLEIEYTKVHEFQETLDVNTMGVVRVTKTFLPLLRKSKGRVITVTSMAAYVNPPLMASYSMSKSATSSFCNVLRQEMHGWGVKVVTVVPEFFKTNITDRGASQSRLNEYEKNLDDELKGAYGVQYFEKNREIFAKEISCHKVYKVIDSLEKSVCFEEPNHSYQPTRNIFCDFIAPVIEILPRCIIDVICYACLYMVGSPVAQRRAM